MGNVAYCQEEIFGFNSDSTDQVVDHGLGHAVIFKYPLSVHTQLSHATKASKVRELCNLSGSGTDARLDSPAGMRDATCPFLLPLTTVFRISLHSNINVVLWLRDPAATVSFGIYSVSLVAWVTKSSVQIPERSITRFVPK
jgi:hypothetical protein